MGKKIIYRPYQSKDAASLAHIILDTWSFDGGICDSELSVHIGYEYLYFCMLHADYTQIVEIDGQVEGIIIGRTEGKRIDLQSGFKCIYHGLILMLSGVNKKISPLFDRYAANSKLLEELSGVAEGKFGAEVALFIVSKQARGYGLGSALFERLNSFFSAKGIEHYYLHTDSACSYEFYERKGLRRLAAIQTELSYAGVDNIGMFVYGK